MPLSANPSTALRQLQSETAALREAPVPRVPRMAIHLLAGLLAASVGVTFLIPVDRVVTSQSGKIVPTQAVNVYQALDPSIIKTINVTEGETVEAGQLLATLDQTFAAADVSQLKQQIASLDAQIERAQAELEGREPFFRANDSYHLRYNALQRSLFLQRRSQYGSQLASFEDKVNQTKATIEKLKNDEARYGEREKISKQIEIMRSTLVEKQAGSLLNLYTATDQRLEMLRTMENEHNSLLEAQHQLASLQADTDAFRQQWAATLTQELVTARNTRDQAAASLAKASKHQDLVVLRASEPAVVLSMAKLSVGAVLKEGDELMRLMPTRTPLEAEVTVLSRDVGFLRPGDPVILKIDAFNSAEHGFASGHVRWISEGAFLTEENGQPAPLPYYKARVGVDEFHFIGVPKSFRLIPGLTLVADIKVGTRSLARYLLGSALQGTGESMREP